MPTWTAGHLRQIFSCVFALSHLIHWIIDIQMFCFARPISVVVDLVTRGYLTCRKSLQQLESALKSCLLILSTLWFDSSDISTCKMAVCLELWNRMSLNVWFWRDSSLYGINIPWHRWLSYVLLWIEFVLLIEETSTEVSTLVIVPATADDCLLPLPSLSEQRIVCRLASVRHTA